MFLTYKVENALTNHILQFEENLNCSILKSDSKYGKRHFPIYSYGKSACILRLPLE